MRLLFAIILVCAGLFLAGCAAPNNNGLNQTNSTNVCHCFSGAHAVNYSNGSCACVSDNENNTRPPRGSEGGFCGGIAAFQCDTGLVCQLDGNYPDAGGKCIKPIPGETVARDWLQTKTPTYLFDAIPGTLKLVESKTPGIYGSACDQYTYSFQSSHAGYGNRTGLMLAQVITDHNTTIQVCGVSVSYANTDGVYDEMRSSDICMLLSAVIPVCGVDNKTYQHPCFAKVKGIAIAHNGACSNGTGIPNPASQFCVDNGGSLSIVDEPNGQVGFCTLPNSTHVEEWNYFRSNGNLSEPIACTLEYSPMCGSDGVTYGNPCQAHAAGAAIVSVGECPAGGMGNLTNKTYVRTTPHCVVNFMCIKGTIPFSGEKGCGCEPIPTMTESLCNSSGGHWAQVVIDPRQACLDTGETNCPMVMAYQTHACQCGGIAGWQCPNGFECGNYKPNATTPDALGICKSLGG